MTISGNAVVGSNALIMSGTVFGHDTIIYDHAVIGAQVFIGGHTRVGESSYLASGCVISDRITIGANSIVSLGSVVYKDVPDGVIVMGNPARIIRNNDSLKVFK